MTISAAFNILIGGEAGQGLVTVGEILARSLVRSGYSIVVTQSYQSRIRGGHNTFSIRVGTEEILAPQESIDFLVALNAETVVLHREKLLPQGFIIADETSACDDDTCLKVPFKQLAAERYANIVALGVTGALLGLNEGIIVQTMDDFFGRKHADLAGENRQAITAAFQWTVSKDLSGRHLPSILSPRRRLMMNGNDAIALGALSAGLKFYAFYPMTPSTSIGLSLAARTKKMGVVVEQAEDEIAAINMAIGASFAGAPSMVATSGGGFALMVEGVSLAGMTETPIVIVVAQRPAPATGLPTRTEQADLLFVLHAGHGEFPRAIFAPGTVEECFHLTRRAHTCAERYQSPVFLLTDQFLADSYRAVFPFQLEGISPIQPGRESVPVSLPYKRYAITESGISPRLLPGMTERLVVAGSDEHTEDGHLTEDLSVRKEMVEKRLRKYRGMQSEVIPPEISGDKKPEILLVSWGSIRGAVLEAASIMRKEGKRVKTLSFPQVWPLVPELFLPALQEAGKVVCVEGNASGQLAGLIRQETGFHIEKRVLRYDGLPHTPESILREL